jgi:transcriptional regulator with XRE-family HTH domain
MMSGMMTLSQYLHDNGATQADFAKRVGTSQAHISRLVGGDTPSLQLALKIETATSGAVPVRVWQTAPSSEGV